MTDRERSRVPLLLAAAGTVVVGAGLWAGGDALAGGRDHGAPAVAAVALATWSLLRSPPHRGVPVAPPPAPATGSPSPVTRPPSPAARTPVPTKPPPSPVPSGLPQAGLPGTARPVPYPTLTVTSTPHPPSLRPTPSPASP